MALTQPDRYEYRCIRTGRKLSFDGIAALQQFWVRGRKRKRGGSFSVSYDRRWTILPRERRLAAVCSWEA